MAHLQYMPGDPRLVDQLVYELKSKGIFDQFRKDCIADVDTRPAYQNLRQRVETSVSTFLARQCWKPDLNKNQLREKLRKHILDGNYLEQGVERIVDQVVNPKVATVFIPQVEDLVYNYLGIPRKKAPGPETDEKKLEDLLPTDLEAVSPGSVKSNDGKNEAMEIDHTEKMDIEEEQEFKDEKTITDAEKKENLDIEMSEVTIKSNDSQSMDKSSIPLPTEEIKLENIPAPVNSPPKSTKVELDSISLPHEPNLSTDIPLPDGAPKSEKDYFFKPILHSEESGSSSDSSLRRNMSPLTPIRNFNNENSCDAQQGFEDDSDSKSEEKAAPSSFRFTIETKDAKENHSDNNVEIKKEAEKLKTEQTDLSYQFTNQVNINTYKTPMYDDSSNSNNLHIDYESDVNSKTNTEMKPEIENSQDFKKDKKSDERKSHKSSHRSRDSSRHSSSKDRRSDSKHSTSRDSSRHDKKSSKDDKSKSSKEKDRSKDRSERKDKDSSKHDSSRSSHKSSKDKDSKSHRSSSSSHRQSSKSSDERKSSSSKDKDKISESSRDKSKDKPRDSKSSSNKTDKDRKSSSSSKKSDDKDKKKEKKDIDDHYSSSGRGNHTRRSTDRDSNDGSSSSKGSQNHNGSKSSENKKDSKSSSSKSDNTSTSGESPSPSDKEHIVQDNSKLSQFKPIIRVDNHLETPITAPPRLPFVPDITLKKPKFAANLQEAKKFMKMRKFLDEEQKRMNQEAALLLEFQANVRPSLSQVYSSIPGPELEFACGSTTPVDSEPYEIENLPTDEKIARKNNSTDGEIEKSEDVISEAIPSVNSKDAENIESKEIQENIVNVISLQEGPFETDNLESPQEPDEKNDTYDENKPFSELMNEITKYSKASEIKTKSDTEESPSKTEDFEENIPTIVVQQVTGSTKVLETTNIVENKYFEVTIITEELSESEETVFETIDEVIEDKSELKNIDSTQIGNDETDSIVHTDVDSVFTETNTVSIETDTVTEQGIASTEEVSLKYFAEHEKYSAELERHEFSCFLSNFMETVNVKKKIYLVNCDTYEENVMRETASTMGDFEVIIYYKNGHLKLPNTKRNIVKDVPLSSEITLPVESKNYEEKSPLFSPVKSECSFELHSDYDTKLDDINKKSRQEVMEIILGSIIDSSPSKMPKIDYFTESTIDNESENENTEIQSETENTLITTDVVTETNNLKRSIDEVESSVNNNRSVLTPKKMRKLSDSDQISSTTEESEEASNNNKVCASARSKYLGRARRVGLPRPKRNNLSNSPSSDKSVENYVQNTPLPPTPNGKIKTTPRTKVQRYDTSDLYKPKLHYLSRRHNAFGRPKKLEPWTFLPSQ